MNDIGQRVKNFRKAKGLTQQELELEIGAACGHISRIESGQINPSKEILFKITHALKLDSKQARSLINFHSQKVFPSEIEEVSNYVSSYMKESSNPVYLADDMWFVHSWNKKAQELLEIPDEMVPYLKGAHELEVFFHPEIPLRKNLDSKNWEQFAFSQLKHFIHDVGIKYRREEEWFKDLFKNLKELPDFDRLWEKALESDRSFLPREERFFVFDVNGKKVKFFISILNIDRFPRFDLIELLPKRGS